MYESSNAGGSMAKTISLKKTEKLHTDFIGKKLHPRCSYCVERFECESLTTEEGRPELDCFYVREYDSNKQLLEETLGDWLSKSKK